MSDGGQRRRVRTVVSAAVRVVDDDRFLAVLQWRLDQCIQREAIFGSVSRSPCSMRMRDASAWSPRVQLENSALSVLLVGRSTGLPVRV